MNERMLDPCFRVLFSEPAEDIRPLLSLGTCLPFLRGSRSVLKSNSSCFVRLDLGCPNPLKAGQPLGFLGAMTPQLLGPPCLTVPWTLAWTNFCPNPAVTWTQNWPSWMVLLTQPSEVGRPLRPELPQMVVPVVLLSSLSARVTTSPLPMKKF